MATTRKKEKKKVFNAVRHLEAEKARKAGLPVHLGGDWEDLEALMRPFNEESVIVAREAEEELILLETGRTAAEGVPDKDLVRMNRAAVKAALAGIQWTTTSNREMLAVARREGWEVDGDDVTITWGANEAAVREFLTPLIDGSDSLLLALVRAGRRLEKLSDEKVLELAELGKGSTSTPPAKSA